MAKKKIGKHKPKNDIEIKKELDEAMKGDLYHLNELVKKTIGICAHCKMEKEVIELLGGDKFCKSCGDELWFGGR